MNKQYDIFLEGKKIGTTRLEKADAPMRVVFGEIAFDDAAIDYNYIKSYCVKKEIFFTDNIKEKSISTYSIPGLKITNSNKIEIKGDSCYLAGTNVDGFEIYIEAIPYPFYGEEFPHHVQEYNDRFKNKI